MIKLPKKNIDPPKFPERAMKINQVSQTHIQVEIQINQSTRQSIEREISQDNQLHAYHHNNKF